MRLCGCMKDVCHCCFVLVLAKTRGGGESLLGSVPQKADSETERERGRGYRRHVTGKNGVQTAPQVRGSQLGRQKVSLFGQGEIRRSECTPLHFFKHETQITDQYRPKRMLGRRPRLETQGHACTHALTHLHTDHTREEEEKNRRTSVHSSTEPTRTHASIRRRTDL